MWGNIHFLDDDTLDAVISQDKVSLVFFLLAENLECRMQASVICEMAAAHGEDYNFIVLDVVECKEAVKRFDISNVPSVVFVRKGIPIGGYNGVIKKKHRQELVERLAYIQKEPLEKQFPGYRVVS